MTDETPKGTIVDVQATGHAIDLRASAGRLLQPIQPEASSEILAKIGWVALMSAYLERLLDRMIWLLLGGAPADAALQTRRLVGAEQRINEILKLGEAQGLPGGVLSQLRGIRQVAIDVSEQRARIIHDPWYADVDSGRLAQFRAMPKRAPEPVFDYVEVSPGEVDQVLVRQTELWNALAPIHNTISALQAEL